MLSYMLCVGNQIYLVRILQGLKPYEIATNKIYFLHLIAVMKFKEDRCPILSSKRSYCQYAHVHVEVRTQLG